MNSNLFMAFNPYLIVNIRCYYITDIQSYLGNPIDKIFENALQNNAYFISISGKSPK